MHLSGIFLGSVALRIVSFFCACVSNMYYRLLPHSLMYAHRDVCMGQAHSQVYRQAGRSLCLNMQLYWLLLATLVVDIETLGS